MRLLAWIRRLLHLKTTILGFAPPRANLCPLNRDSCLDCELATHEVRDKDEDGFNLILLCKHPEAVERGLAILQYHT